MRAFGRITGLLLIGCVARTGLGALTFTGEDFYGDNAFSTSIFQYDLSGHLLGTLQLPPSVASDLRGLAFGPDHLLYVVNYNGSRFSVLALNQSGTVQKTYPSTYFIGNASQGKIAFDNSGHFYVTANAGVIGFTVNDTGSAHVVLPNGGDGPRDVAPLPSGNFLLALRYNLFEVTSSGNEVREIGPFLSNGGSIYTDLHGVDYDAATNSIFATMAGDSDRPSFVMRVGFTSGRLLDGITYLGCDDILVAHDGHIVVGSSRTSPSFFTRDLVPSGQFEGGAATFMTQLPDPSAVGYLFVAAPGLILKRRKREP